MATDDPTQILTDAVDEYVAALPDEDFNALVARTREPSDDTDKQKSKQDTGGIQRGRDIYNQRKGNR